MQQSPKDTPIHREVEAVNVENVQQLPSSFTKFWNSGGKYLPAVIGALVAYIVLIVLASQQGDSAESSSRSAIYTTPNIDNTGWTVKSAVTPYAYGGIWNPAAYTLGSGSVNNSQVGARIEMSFSAFSPSYTGGTSSVLFRLVLNPSWMDTTSKPSKPLFNVYCYVGNSKLTLTTASTSSYVDLYTSNFPFDSGTILKYPVDSYQVLTNIYCTYSTTYTAPVTSSSVPPTASSASADETESPSVVPTNQPTEVPSSIAETDIPSVRPTYLLTEVPSSVNETVQAAKNMPIATLKTMALDALPSEQSFTMMASSSGAAPSTKTGYLNFNLAVANKDVGLFTPSATFGNPSASHSTLYYTSTDDYTGDSITHNGNYSYVDINSESVTVRLTRGSINVFFPIFMTIIMWMLIIAETMIFVPYYLEKKKADAPGIPLGCVGILFALPNIRNTMPGAPPLGVVLDFAAYFWCLTIAAGHFLTVSWYWVGLASNFSSKDIVPTLLRLVGRRT